MWWYKVQPVQCAYMEKKPVGRLGPHFSVAWPLWAIYCKMTSGRCEICVFDVERLPLRKCNVVKKGAFYFAAGLSGTVRLWGCLKMVWPLGARLPGSRAFSMHGSVLGFYPKFRLNIMIWENSSDHFSTSFITFLNCWSVKLSLRIHVAISMNLTKIE